MPSSSCVSATRRGSVMPSRERRREAGLGLVVGQRRERLAAGEQRVLHRALGPVDRRGGGEVVGEIGDPRPVAGVALERLAHAQVQLGAPQPRHAVVERPAHELVGELVGELPRRDLLDHPVRDRLLQRRAGAADDRQIELVPGDGGELEHVDGRRVQAREALADDLPHALRDCAGRRASRPASRPPSAPRCRRSVRHSSVMRNALPPVSSRSERATSPSSARGSRSPARSTNSAISSALRPASRTRTTPSVRRRSASADDSVSGTSASVSRNVVRTSAVRVRRAAREVAQQQQRRRDRPSARPPRRRRAACACHGGEQVGDRAVQPVALGVGIRRRRRRQLADALGQVGQQARELAAALAEVGAQLGGIGRRARAGRAPRRTGGTGAGPPRRRRRRARRRRRGVRLLGELADQAALARAGLAADEREPQPVAVGRRDAGPAASRAPSSVPRTGTTGSGGADQGAWASSASSQV